MMFERFFLGLSEALQGARDFLGFHVTSPVRLYTSDQDGVLVCDDGSMVSLIGLDGSYQLLGDEEFGEFLEGLSTVLGVTLGKSFHALQVMYHYDPEAARTTIGEQFRALHRQAKSVQLDLVNVLEDWQEALIHTCAEEVVYLALWTRPWALSRTELKRARKAVTCENVLARRDHQGRSVTIARLRDLHLAQVRRLVSFLQSKKFAVQTFSCREAILRLRMLLLPEQTSRNWRPSLAENAHFLAAPEQGSARGDCSFALPKTLAEQICAMDAERLNWRQVRLGNRIYAPFLLELAPQQLLPFNTLLQGLKGTMPFRVIFLLTGDGLGRAGLKTLLAQVLSFAGQTNKMYVHACKALQKAAMEGVTIVGLQALFCTWVAATEAHATTLLQERSMRLQTHVQSWGSCETNDLLGDPLLGVLATVPALMPTQPSPKAIAPLTEALSLLPLTRVSSPWQMCDLPLRTPDGKFMPIGLFHSSQASWNEVAFAGMGAGKSFFLNTLNFFFLLRPGQARLPWLTVIDIGPSCSGVINLFKWALPPRLQHLAVHARLKNSASRAINPFDTPLGCREPLRNHAEFLNNLLALLCTPLDRTAPGDGVQALLREAVAQLYRAMGPEGPRARLYDPFVDAEISAALEQLQYRTDARTTWWEIVQFLFEQEEFVLAERAQRRAMPLLADLASQVTEQNCSENYAMVQAGSGGESVPHACARYLVAAIAEYPILSNPTCFSLGSAQIIGLDLSEVTPRGGAQAQRQSAIMYMLARFVGAEHFFCTMDDLEDIPPGFRDYHRKRLENLCADPKRLCYDEFHRASCQDMNNPLSRQIISDLTTASRESRKRNLSIGLYSQRLEDFPAELVAMATSIYALGAGNAKEAEEIAKRFGFNHAAYVALRAITRPTPEGASLVALYRTEKGESVLHLTNCAGSYARWAFSTTAEDMRLRNRLYKHLGLRKTLDLLHAVYPEGSIKGELERRKAQLTEEGREGGGDLEEELLSELMQKSEQMCR